MTETLTLFDAPATAAPVSTPWPNLVRPWDPETRAAALVARLAADGILTIVEDES